MKKTLNSLLAFICAVVMLAVPSQTQAQTFTTGAVLIDLFAGGPNFSKTLVGDGLDFDTETTEKITGLLPIGLRAEYLVTEKIGIGLEVTYASGKREVTETDGNETYVSSWEHSKLRVLPTMNLHFLDNEMVDLYLAIGAGFKTASYTFKSNDPDVVDDLEIPTGKVASKISLGTRIFFSDNIGVNLAFGIGGPLVNGGLTFRF